MELLLVLPAVVVVLWVALRAGRGPSVRPMTERQRDDIVDLLEDLGDDEPEGAFFDGKTLDGSPGLQ